MFVHHKEYVEANQGTIEQLKEVAGQLLERDPRGIVTDAGTDSDAVLRQTPYSPAYFNELFDGNLTVHQAQELTRIQNESLITAGRQAIHTARTRCSVLYVVECAMQGLEDKAREDGVLYESAEYTVVEPDVPLTIGRAILKGVQEVGTFEMLSVSAQEDALTSTLTILSNEGQVVDIKRDVEPTEDHEIDDWSNLLKESFDQRLFNVLAGRFDSEEDLNAVLDEVKSEFDSSPLEANVTAALAAIKRRAIGAKEALRMNTLFQAYLPSQESLISTTQQLARFI